MVSAEALTIELATVKQRETLVNLLQLYFYDFSEIDDDDAEVDDRGRFPAYYYLDRYFEERERQPFLFRVGGRLAGFALVRQRPSGGDEPHWSMAEFFILRRYRRRGIGRRAAVALFERLPGRWEVAEIRRNVAGIAFWRRVIGDYTGGRFSESGADEAGSEGPVQVFRSPA